MKSRTFILVVCLFVVCIITGGGGAEEQQPKKVMTFLAVMDLSCGSGIDKPICKSLTDVIIDALVLVGTYTVIDRANRDKILSEQGFQQTGCVEESCTVDAGRLLGVGKIVLGSITKIGETYIVNLQLINVQTGTVEISASERCKCDLDGLLDTVTNAARKLMGEAPLTTSFGQTRVQPSNVKPGEMVKVPAGEFIMGSDSGEADEKPVHKVYLDAYYIDRYEVTNEQYAACVQADKCGDNQKYDGFTDPKQPVVGVDWNQASTFCSWVGKRLPTEAEWEKAARGTDGRTYPWGEEIDCGKANYVDCKNGKTKPVESYPSGVSLYGVMDMAGNVWEWTADWYDEKYYASSPGRNPKGPSSGSFRVLRGGSWGNNASYLRSSYRYYRGPGLTIEDIGFRCARD